METLSIQVRKRTGTGKGPNRRTRRAGNIPGVFYGPKVAEPLLLEIDRKEFAKKLGSLVGSHLIQFESEAADLKSRMVLLREVQTHPLTGAVLHTDFYEVDLTKKLEVTVPLRFEGKAAGIEAGGILQPIVREITVLCLPTEIPEFVAVDVSSLGIHDAVHAEDLVLPPGAEGVFDSNFTVVTVLPPTIEEVKVEAAAEGEAAAPAEGAAEGAPAAGAPAAGAKAEAKKPEKSES